MRASGAQFNLVGHDPKQTPFLKKSPAVQHMCFHLLPRDPAEQICWLESSSKRHTTCQPLASRMPGRWAGPRTPQPGFWQNPCCQNTHHYHQQSKRHHAML